MIKDLNDFLFFLATLFSCLANSQTFWTGPSVKFTKENYANWIDEENQDSLTSNVIITRADERGIFNIAQELSYDNINGESPIDTEWANGSLSDGIENLNFTFWGQTGKPRTQVGIKKVMHLITDDIYVDIVFTSWTQGAGGSGQTFGGGFSYVRSSPPLTNINNDFLENIKIYPNQVNSELKIIGNKEKFEFKILDIFGSVVKTGRASSNSKIVVSELLKGSYFIIINNSNLILRFVKL